MAPVKTAFGGLDGKVTDRLIDYYRRRAMGGVGAIIVEPMFIDPIGKEHPKQLGIDDDDKIDGLRRLVDAIHKERGIAIAHINHAGRAANPKASGSAPSAPSAITCPSTGATPEVMSAERITSVIDAFGSAAGRARSAGFDGIELQCGLGYLVAQFLSPRTNLREDEWGQERMRFAEQTIDAVIEAAGGMLVSARLSGSEKVEGGLGPADARRLGQMLVERGVHAIHVASGSACDTPPWYYQHMSLPSGINTELARELRSQLDVPIIAAGRLGDPKEIERLFQEEVIDLVALGRPLVADPDLVNKMKKGHPELVVQCGGCLQGCLTGVKAGKGIGCIVNPELGLEGKTFSPAERKKRVVVVGGGPAGLTAARVAAERGHHVTLLERAQDLGGQFALSHLAPGKQAMRHTLDALVRLTRASGAEIHLGTEATLDSVMAHEPDEVLIATGAEPIVPPIEGLTDALTGEQVLTKARSVSGRVLVIGGGLVGIEVAELLAEGGEEIVVVEMLEEIARDMEPITRKLTLKRLASLPVTIHTETKVIRIADGRVLASGATGELDLGAFNAVVLATGTRPLDPLSRALRERGASVHTIGDANSIGQVQGATISAFEVATTL